MGSPKRPSTSVRVGGSGLNADGRMGLLVGGGYGGDLDVLELAVVAEGFSLPCFEDYVEGFLEALTALLK